MKVAPIFTGDRQVDTFAREVTAKLDELEDALDVATTDRIMPLDGMTALYWPCADGAAASGAATIAEAVTGLTLDLTSGGGAMSAYEGQTRRGCLRLYGADANRYASSRTTAPATLTGSQQFTVSCWVRFGKFTAAGEDYVVSYSNAAMANYSFILGATLSGAPLAQPVPRFYVTRGAGTTSAIGDRDGGMAPGQWCFLWGTYDGTEAVVGVNSVASSTAIGVASAMNWTPGANMRVRIGNNAASGFAGQVQDVRIDLGVRSQDWIREAYERGARWTA